MESTAIPQSGHRVIAAYLVLCAISLAPILVFDHPPIVDHPNHLARLYVLQSPSGSPLDQIYAPAWGLIPNVGIDALGVVFHPWLSPEAILKLIAILGMGGVLLAVALLQRRILGAVNPSLWLATLPIFNIATTMGYLNYFLGLAVALLGFQLWLVLEERSLWLKLLVFNTIGAILFFCHVSALAVFGVVVFSYDLSRLLRAGSSDPASLLVFVGKLGAVFALPCFLVLLAERPEHIASIDYRGKGRVLMAATYVANWPSFLVVSIAFFLACYELLRSRLLFVAPAMRATLVLLGLATLLLPSHLSLAIDVDSRVFVGLVFLLIASTRIVNPRPRRTAALLVVLFAVVSLRSLLIADQWRAWSDEVAAFRRAIAAIEPGAALLVAGWPPEAAELECAEVRSEPSSVFWHVPSFAVVDRAAFVPLLFTGKGAQPIRATRPYLPLDVEAGTPVPLNLLELAARPELADRLRRALEQEQIPGYFLDWPWHFDYLVFLHQGCPRPILPEHLTGLTDGSFYSLYRIRPGSGRVQGGRLESRPTRSEAKPSEGQSPSASEQRARGLAELAARAG